MSRNHVAKSCREIMSRNRIAKPYCETILVAFTKAHSFWECKLQISPKIAAGSTRLLIANDESMDPKTADDAHGSANSIHLETLQ